MNLGFRGLLLILIVVGMPVASYFLVFRPQNAEIMRARAEVEHKESMLVKLQEETARNADLVRANEDIRASVRAIEARLPSEKELDAIVRQVSDLAVLSGLQPPAMKAEKPVPAALYMEQPLTMEVNGTDAGVFAFLAHIEKLPRITRIHDLKIQSSGRNDGQVRVTFTLSIYFQDEAQMAKVGP
jgi:type IV pilus assembly protein PilO